MGAGHQAGFDFLNEFSGSFFVIGWPFCPEPENPSFFL
jgi:hypothetical protein